MFFSLFYLIDRNVTRTTKAIDRDSEEKARAAPRNTSKSPLYNNLLLFNIAIQIYDYCVSAFEILNN